ncbi:MAG TPA: hypothetical protein PLV08_13200 [Flavobacteriales bacterium]|jgi:hypothetical protein|nr:hypothetical protein [Flavobacteriales bacterium]MBK7112643.1 hypothetical protein [Flavobacteriales bacterium]MBK7620481.1 hypothetical protein [Flavobacteriales bacterium]MBK8531431.1 hypothetical protein [Flavobacteriales bacterium]MBK8708365.1 hypothetical protein [Flavobacteriales bacterium]
MIRSLLLLFTSTLAWGATAQALLILPETGDVHDLHFNPKFIQRNHISAIIGQRMVKREGEPMRERNEKYLYRFNTIGLPVYSNNSFGQPGSGRDTASTTYTYDTGGRVMRRLRNDLSGHFAYENELDAKGRVVRETYTRVENLGTDRYNLIPGKVSEISDEHFRYEALSDTVLKKVHINNYDLPFREQLFVTDQLGYLRRMEDRYLISNRRSRVSFSYDEKGRLAERIEQPDLDQPRTMKRVWRYDAAGNVIEGELWHDDRQQERDEYLYDAHTMELKARLTKDLISGVIHVVRFTTERN